MLVTLFRKAMANELRQAISLLYAPGTPASQRAAANEWLLRAVEQPEAWLVNAASAEDGVQLSRILCVLEEAWFRFARVFLFKTKSGPRRFSS